MVSNATTSSAVTLNALFCLMKGIYSSRLNIRIGVKSRSLREVEVGWGSLGVVGRLSVLGHDTLITHEAIVQSAVLYYENLVPIFHTSCRCYKEFLFLVRCVYVSVLSLPSSSFCVFEPLSNACSFVFFPTFLLRLLVP